MDVRQLSKNLDVDEDIMLQLLDVWLETVRADIDELKKEISGGDCENVVHRAHKIKGASAQLGLNEAAEIARRLEMEAKNKNLANLGRSIELIIKKHEEVLEIKKMYLNGRQL